MHPRALAEKRDIAIKEISAKTGVDLTKTYHRNAQIRELFALQAINEALEDAREQTSVEDLMHVISDVPGVGPALENKIREALEAM